MTTTGCEPEARTVRGDGVDLHLRVAGPPGAPVVVCVHGFPDTSAVWVPVAERLADRFRVVAYDVRGTGRSSVPVPRRGGWRLDRLTADFLAVAHAVSPDRPVHLVGHDWGSTQSWAFVVDEVAARRIASFTSISGPSLDLVRPWLAGASRSPRRALAAAGQAVRSSYVLVLRIPRLPEAALRRQGAALHRRLLTQSGVADPDRFVADTFLDDARHGLELYRQNADRARHPRPVPPGAVTVPVQLLVPTRDPYLSPSLYDDLRVVVPDLVRHDIAAGHWVQLSHPDEVADRIAGHVDGVEAATASSSSPSGAVAPADG